MKAVEEAAGHKGLRAGTGVEDGNGAGSKDHARIVIPGFGGVLNPLSLGKAGPRPEVCVVFMTVERQGLERQYIEVGTYIQSRPHQFTTCVPPALPLYPT